MAELPGLQLSKVHNYLLQELRPLSSAEILDAIGVDIEASPELLLSLQGEESKVRRDKDGRWRWKSRHYLTGLNDLVQLFSHAQEGIFENVLYDSYRGVREDIAKLKARGGVYALKSGSRVVLYRRDQHLETSVSDEVRGRYNAVPLPDAIEIHRYLVANGLKDSDDVNGTKIAAPMTRKRPRKQEKKRAKKVKLTNVHLENIGIDLNKDYQHGKGSAFD
jgi:hypothetical protein